MVAYVGCRPHIRLAFMLYVFEQTLQRRLANSKNSVKKDLIQRIFLFKSSSVVEKAQAAILK